MSQLEIHLLHKGQKKNHSHLFKYFVLVWAETCLTSGMCDDYFCVIMTLDRNVQPVLSSHMWTSYPQ